MSWNECLGLGMRMYDLLTCWMSCCCISCVAFVDIHVRPKE